MTILSPAPPAPNRSNPGTFPDLADAYVAWLSTVSTQLEASLGTPEAASATLGLGSAPQSTAAFGNGSAANPTVFFRAGADRAGLFSPAASTLAISVAGSHLCRFVPNEIRIGQTNETFPGLGNTTTGHSINTAGFMLASADDFAPLGLNRNTTNGQIAQFRRQGVSAVVGSISVTTTGTSFNETSDYRLKNEADAPEGWNAADRVKAIAGELRHYTWKATGELAYGAFAHELSRAAPHAVTGEKDAVNEKGEIEPQQVDWSKLVPELTAALADALARIEVLEASS